MFSSAGHREATQEAGVATQISTDGQDWEATAILKVSEGIHSTLLAKGEVREEAGEVRRGCDFSQVPHHPQPASVIFSGTVNKLS